MQDLLPALAFVGLQSKATRAPLSLASRRQPVPSRHQQLARGKAQLPYMQQYREKENCGRQFLDFSNTPCGAAINRYFVQYTAKIL